MDDPNTAGYPKLAEKLGEEALAELDRLIRTLVREEIGDESRRAELHADDYQPRHREM